MKKLGYFLGFIVLVLLIAFGILYTPDVPLEKLKAKYTDVESQFVVVDGMQVHYKDEGNGPAIVLLHGTASSLHTWDAWATRLKGDYRVIRMDLPAFGLTGPNANNDYTSEAYVTFLHSFLKAIDVDSFVLAGNSLGGSIAWNYAIDYPEQVKKLILLDASGYPVNRPAPLVFKLGRTPVLKSLIKYISPRSLYVTSVLDVYGNDSLVTDALVDRYYDLSLRPGNRDALVARMNLNYESRYKDLEKVTCPTLIQWGELDVWVPLEDGKKFDTDIPNSYLIVYKGVGHVPMEEAPERTVSDAIGFIQAKI